MKGLIHFPVLRWKLGYERGIDSLCVRLILIIRGTFRGILIFKDSINSCVFFLFYIILPIYFVTRHRKGCWNFEQLQLVGLGCYQ